MSGSAKRSLLPLACGALLALALAPVGAAAQACEAVNIGTFNVQNQGLPNQVAFLENAEFSCPGGKRLYASQAISSRASGIINLIGNVRYSDGDRTMTTDRADYFSNEQKVTAYENTLVTDQKSGSTLRGQRIDYTPARAGREAYMMAYPAQPRPRATIMDDGVKTTVEADQIELLGENRFRGTGNAQIVRDTLRGYGAIVEFDQASGAMTLAVQARIDGTEYDLTGDTITATVAGDTLREVNARGNGVLDTETVLVEAPTIRITLNAGQVERMIAALRRQAVAGVANAQPRVTSEDFLLTADSIDVLAPRQELELLTAVGRAYGQVQDTLAPPPGSAELDGLLDTDWMRGDTVQAFFVANPKAVTDTTADTRVLERVVTSGEPASALYRRQEGRAAAAAEPAPAAGTPPPVTPAAQYSVGYLLARRIEVHMADGEVKDIQASEDVRGVYLEPRGAARGSARR